MDKIHVLKGDLRSGLILDVFNENLRQFPPAYGITRMLKNDTCLEYRLEGEGLSRKHIFYKGEAITPMMYKLAEKNLNYFPFGSGPHRCPGEAVVRSEITEMISQLAENYIVTTTQHREIEKLGLVTLHLKEDVFIKLSKRT